MRTIGKNRGLARLADADGHFRMVALDQRPPLFDAIAKAKGITREQVEYSDVTAAKRLLVENLAPHCSSMLFDPNFAVPAAILVPYEDPEAFAMAAESLLKNPASWREHRRLGLEIAESYTPDRCAAALEGAIQWVLGGGWHRELNTLRGPR